MTTPDGFVQDISALPVAVDGDNGAFGDRGITLTVVSLEATLKLEQAVEFLLQALTLKSQSPSVKPVKVLLVVVTPLLAVNQLPLLFNRICKS